MSESGRFKRFLGKTGYVLDCIVLAALFVVAVGVLVRTLWKDIPRIYLHNALAIGFAAFFLLFLIPRIRKNTRWMMKFNHEFTHLVFALLFFRKIHRFKVDETDSHVSYSGGWFGYLPITVSPYCVPLITLGLLPWRFTTQNEKYLFIITVLIGFSFAFHVCCWISQLRLYQTDITGPGIMKSLLTIVSFQIINFCLVLLTPSSGVLVALTRVFWEFPRDFVLQVLSMLS